MSNVNMPQYSDVFQLIKGIPAADIARRFGVDLQQKGGRWQGLCPFHEEKTPSFKVHNNRFHCFGCNWSGDGIDIVGELLNLDPLSAAREIAGTFGLAMTSPLKGAALREYQQERERKRQVEAAFRDWRERTFRGIAVYLRACDRIIAAGPGLPGYEASCFLRPKAEYLFDILNGPVEGQVRLFREYGWGWTV